MSLDGEEYPGVPPVYIESEAPGLSPSLKVSMPVFNLYLDPVARAKLAVCRDRNSVNTQMPIYLNPRHQSLAAP